MTYYSEPESGQRFTLVRRDEVEEGTVRATARAVLQEIGAQQRRGGEPDLVAALETVADRETPDEVFEHFQHLRDKHQRVARQYRDRVQSYNRAIETLNKYNREGVITREHRQDHDAAEDAAEKLDAEIAELSNRLDEIREEIKRVGKRLDREIYAVAVLPRSPSLAVPDDPRSTVQERRTAVSRRGRIR